MKTKTNNNMIPITKPTLSKFKKYAPKFREIIESGIITNGPNVKKLEEEVARYVGSRYCVAVSSCTSGLMLVLKGLGLKGEVILPSFTFSASGHVILWNNLTPVFADIKEDTYEVDPASIEKLITPKTSAILAIQIFGNPCNIAVLEKIAKKRHLKLIFDAAHALGSKRGNKKVGVFGDAEVFSCSPTKLLTTGEGGLIVTNNKELADFCRIGRNYGDDGSYDTKFNGLNARMSEFHAVVGLESLKNLDRAVRLRNQMAEYYKAGLAKIDPALSFQKIMPGDVTTYKDFSVFIDPKKSGYNRDELCNYLSSKNIISKKYFYPPLHQQQTYRKISLGADKNLPVTNRVSGNVLSLPLFSHISRKEVNLVLEAIKEFYDR
jgi:dTDP-4-amino-4,6-dideoxygalactose transaminase